MTNSRFQNPRAYFGVPLYSATLDFYLTGTNTRQDTYSDSGLTTPNANPVVADSSGNFGEIFLTAGVAYKVVLKDQTGAIIWTADPVEGGTSFSITGSNQFTTISNVLYHTIDPAVISSSTYTLLNADWGALKYFTYSGAITVTLPSPTGSTFLNGWYVYIKNNGTSTLTINASANIDGASSLAISSGNAAMITSNGTTYYTNSNSNKSLVLPYDGSNITIASGAIADTGYSKHTIDTEGGAASDDLDTISGGSDGKCLILSIASSSRNVVIKHNTGNIYNPLGTDITLDTLYDNVLLRYDSTLSKWVVQATSLAKPYPLYARYTHTEAANTNGGSSTSGSFQKRTLNTEHQDDIGITLSSSVLSVPAGTYQVSGYSTFGSANLSTATGIVRLYDTTNSTVLAIGNSGKNTVNSTGMNIKVSFDSVRFTLTGTVNIEMQYYVDTSMANTGLGYAVNLGGQDEVYAELVFQKIA